MKKVKVLLIDDHEIVRAGFGRLLSAEGRFEIIHAETAEQGCKLHMSEKPDIVVTDISMPGMGGLEAIHRILSRDEQARVIVLSMYDDTSYIEKTMKLGAMAYVTKRSAPTELLKAINVVLKGRQYFSEDIDYDINDMQKPSKGINALSRREFEIFSLLAKGESVSQVASYLHISPKTASNHRDSVMRKLQTKNLVEVTRFAIRHGVIEA